MKKNILFLSIILISCTKSFNNSYDPATSAFAKNYYLYGTVVKNIIFPPPAVPIVTIPTKLVYDPSDLGFTTTQTVASTSNTIDFDSSITSVTVSPSFPTGIGFTSTSTGSAKDYRIKPSSPPTVQAATKYTITGCNVSGGCINTDITIQIVNATGNTVWGQNGFFSTSASGVGTTGLNSPKGIALDSSGGLYVVDSGNHRVLYFPVNSQTATRVYGQGGSFALANPNNGGISANSLMYPTAVAVDSSNGLYITDNSNNRILYYTSGNTTATRVYGQAGLFTTDTLVFTPSATNFNFISLNNAGALALDSNNNLYVADPARSRVLFFPNGSTTATRVYGQAGLFTTAVADLNVNTLDNLQTPISVFVSASGIVYILDVRSGTTANPSRILSYTSNQTTASESLLIPTSVSYTFSAFFGSGGIGMYVDNKDGIFLPAPSNTGNTVQYYTSMKSKKPSYEFGDISSTNSRSANGAQHIILDTSGNFYISHPSLNRVVKYNQ